jgi:high-affinity K+ transport system ATPase subunit B
MPNIDIPKKVREFAAMAEALAELVDLADKANAWQQQEAEHQARLAALAEQVAAKRNAVQLADAKEDEARRQAIAIFEQAKKDAATTIAKAAADADTIRKAADEAVEAAKAEESRAEADERKAKANLASLAEQTKLLVAQLAEAQAVIAKADAIKKAMG